MSRLSASRRYGSHAPQGILVTGNCHRGGATAIQAISLVRGAAIRAVIGGEVKVGVVLSLYTWRLATCEGERPPGVARKVRTKGGL